ncbi:MAG: hypothetical protein RLZZ292_1555 [Bacteroidota bacterium]
MKKIAFLYLLIFSFGLNALSAQTKILFDARKAQSAANADWVMDADTYNVAYGNGGVPTTGGTGTEANPQRFPTPLQNTVTASTTEEYWKGGLSSWGLECVKKGYQVETLPISGTLTYGNAGNTQDLSNYNVFIVCEPNILFNPAEKTAIMQFVQNGGGLLMIADHDMSDRNFDNSDSPHIWNDLMINNGVNNNNPFGMTFDFVDFSQTTSNLLTTTNPIINGSFGTVTKAQFSGGTTMTLDPTKNASVKGAVFKTGATNPGNANVMMAFATFGSGKVIGFGDSSPADDGTGDTNDVLYDGWIADAGGAGNHRKLLMNATEWLAGSNALPALNLVTTKQAAKCFGESSGSASVTATGGTGAYTYKWSNGEVTATINTLGAGTYTVTVSATGASSTTASVEITEPPLLVSTLTASVKTVTCKAETTTLTANGTGGFGVYTYLWNTTTTTQTNIVTPSITTTYTVTVTDKNLCKSVSNIVITADKMPPVTTAIGGELTCNQNSITLNAAASPSTVTYLWTGPNNFTSTLQNPSVSNLGTYNVKATNTSNGCSSQYAVSVTSNTVAPTITAVGGQLTCSQSSVLLNVTATTQNLTYAWTGPNNFTSTLQNPSVSNAGTYTVKATNPTNGCSAQSMAIVTSNGAIPTITATGGTLTCIQKEVTLSATSPATGVTYAWTGPNNFTSNLQNPIVSLLGTYTIKVSNPTNGCSSESSVSVTSDTALPTITATGGQLTCSQSTVILTVTSPTPNLTFLWSGPGGLSSSIQNPTFLMAGTYTVKATNPANGCASSTMVEISPLNKMVAKENKITNSTDGKANGSATLTVSGGVAPYTYLWKNALGQTFSTTASLNNVLAGKYTCEVKDASGCIETLTITITNITASEELDATTFFKIYPNPSAEILNIDLTEETPNATLQIFDLLGKIIVEKKLLNKSNTLNISNLEEGIYLINVKSGERKLGIKKLIVVRK